jgi:hypothetical protein
MEAYDMLDSYEQDLDFEKLKISLENASKEASMEMFSCLTHCDNALPQLLRTNYKYRFELLVIIMKKRQ